MNALAPGMVEAMAADGGSADPYLVFLRAKIKLAGFDGIAVAPEEVSPVLKPHQRDIVIWALRGGRRAIFAAFGLGKSLMQLEIMRLLFLKRPASLFLIIAPLGVRGEFLRDVTLLGPVNLRFIKRGWQADAPGLYLTNYEPVRDGHITVSRFDGVSLDEADILRSYGSKTFQTFLTLFDSVAMRFVATATPDPNRYKELIHYAGFLGVMDTGQALTRFFQRDSTKANQLTLYPHKEKEFWLWLHSWAIFIQRPSDLGYSDAGYDLPELEVIPVEVAVNIAGGGIERNGQAQLFNLGGTSLAEEARERRDTLDACVAAMRGLLDAMPEEHCLLWHDLEAERLAIQKAVPNAVSVYGTQDLDEREKAIADFSAGRFQYLSTKPVLAGAGCNFQRHCARAIFIGVSHKFRDFIQAVHRIQRFMQPRAVKIWVIYPETMRETWRDLMAKWARHKEKVAKMSEIIRKYGLNEIAMRDELARVIGVERIEVSSEHYAVAHNDCVLEARRRPENSVGLVVTSIPFSNHYEYTAQYEDFGHTDDNRHFWEQMGFLTPELKRILMPGRLACIHVKDRILFGSVTGAGAPTVSPFHAEAIMHYRQHGFDYMGMITINTDVVRENNQTYRLGYTEMRKDGSKMGVGSPEYVILVRKPQSDRSKGYADIRVEKESDGYSLARWQVDAHAFWRSSGNRLLTAEELAGYGPAMLAKAFTAWSLQAIYDHEFHVRIGEQLEARGALPSTFMSLAPGAHDAWTWHDVNRMRTLNGEQAARNVEKHICPLQFDIVDRLIRRYSNPGELVYDPFGGLMTVPVRAILLGRKGGASELNRQYFLDGCHYLAAAEKQRGMPNLFDIEAMAAADAEPATHDGEAA